MLQRRVKIVSQSLSKEGFAMLTSALKHKHTCFLFTTSLSFGLFCVIVMTWTFFIPDKYASFARYEIVFQQESNGVNSMTNPFRIQEQYEYLKSPTVLHQVIKDLDLSQTYSRQQNINPPLSMDATYQHLLKNMKLQQTRGTTLFEIWVYDEDKALAAMTANQIIEVYKNKKPASIASVSIIDKARPKLNPASPNRPLMLMVGCACSLLVSIILGKIVSLRCQKSTSL